MALGLLREYYNFSHSTFDGEVTANDGYVEPARGRENLTVRGNALVRNCAAIA